MKKIYIVLVLLFIKCSIASAQVITWAEEIAPIMYNHCTTCHHSGAIGGTSFIDYADVFSEGLSIQDKVNTGEMPPWPPDPEYRHLAHERLLSTWEKTAINDWVNNGMPQGNMANAPAPPVYSGTALITNPDYIYQIPNYTVNTATDLYRNFVVPTNLLSQQYITEFEVIPGNRGVVHHVIVWEDTSSTPATLDAADPGTGYTNFGGSGSSTSNMIGLWVPGMGSFKWPTGMGQLLPAGTNIVIQVHYPGGTTNETDSTQIRVKTSSTALRNVYTIPILNHDNTIVDGPLFIPANTTKTFHEQFTVPVFLNLSLISVGPHMHLLGQTALSYGVTLVNDTIPFIKIDHWDFHWQGLYPFKQVLKIPGGTTLYGEASYDNTVNNPENPNNPPQDVSLGESTTDEMLLFYFSFTNYANGDENIIIDSTTVSSIYDPAYESIITTPQLYDPSPNPAQQHVNLSFYLPHGNTVTFKVYDVKGALVKQVMHRFENGLNLHTLDVAGLQSGEYLIEMQSGEVKRTKKLLKE
ncbi:MAG: T9SS type A sorting domain-containing protein [Bacteroidota bacterium]